MEPAPIQLVPIAKHPELILIPCAKVEVAAESDWIPLPFTESPPLKVEVARLATLSEPNVEVAAKRLLDDAVVAKSVVDVALVVVLFNPVKFWNVDEPVIRS